MQKYYSYKIFLSALLIFISVTVSADEIEEGMKAYHDGYYATAYEILRPLAEHHGYSQAMNTLGIMFESGLGVEKQGVEADKWYRKAALEGYPEAMYNLGILHAEGELVPKNLVTAMAWIGAAYDHRQKRAALVARVLSAKMSEEQLAEASEMRKQIDTQIYGSKQPPETFGSALTEPPLEQSQLLTTEQIIEAYSGNSVNFEFRESMLSEHYRMHSSKKRAIAGKKAKTTGEYRDGYYTGKWWVKDNMLCVKTTGIDEFTDCRWIEPLAGNEMRAYSQRTGATIIHRMSSSQ